MRNEIAAAEGLILGTVVSLIFWQAIYLLVF